MSIEEQFNAAVKVIRSLPKNGSFQPSDELKLTFYAYFKQATDGPNDTKKPPFYDIVNRYKWDAWKKVGNLSKEEAMTVYVEELKKVIETLSLNEEVSDFLDILGPFYEFLPEEVSKNSSKSSPGRITDSLQETLEDQITSSSRSFFNTYDSEGDEFSDTVDCTAPQNDKIPVILQNGNISNHFVNGANLYTDNESRQTLIEAKVDQANIPKFVNGPNVVNKTTTAYVSSVNEHNLGFNEQLTMAVFRLQHSLDQVVNRIDALESIRCHKSKSLEERSASTSGVLKWLFPEMNGRTAAFVIAWPLIVYFVINYVKQIRKK